MRELKKQTGWSIVASRERERERGGKTERERDHAESSSSSPTEDRTQAGGRNTG